MAATGMLDLSAIAEMAATLPAIVNSLLKEVQALRSELAAMKEQKHEYERLIDRHEVCEALRISRPTADRLATDGHLPEGFIWQGKRVIPEHEFSAFMHEVIESQGRLGEEEKAHGYRT